MKVTIIKYNAGNTLSVANALERLGVSPVISSDPDVIRSSEKVIFPGVGEASTTMKYLKSRNLDNLISGLKQPFLGICLGMQLMCAYSEEGDTECLGIFDHDVLRFNPNASEEKMKVPHMGWNSISNLDGVLFKEVPEHSYTYFVHSYFVSIGKYTTGTTDYITPFSSSLQKDNFYAVQYHPEKSALVGQQILKNFLSVRS